MRGPTKAQRAVMERIEGGEWLMFDRHQRRGFIGVRQSTGMALVRQHYLFQFDAIDGIVYFRLSDSGRAALAATAARDGAGEAVES